MLAALAVASACAPGVTVRSVSERTFDIEATNASVSSVLRCLADEAGFKLVIDSGVPATEPLTLRLRNRTAVQSVGSIIEGVVLNYALSTDPTEDRLLLLMVSGRTGASRPSPPKAIDPEEGAPQETAVPPPQGMTAPRRVPPRPPETPAGPEKPIPDGGDSEVPPRV